MKGTAIQLDQTLDLALNVQRNSEGLIVQGIQVGQTTNQNVALILLAQAGEFKEYPTLGVGLQDATLDEGDFLGYRHSIRENLERDQLTVKVVDFYKKDNLNVIAEYES